jgi:hypothetical protein
MIDLSDNKHIKRLYMSMCDKSHHSVNLSRIENNIQCNYIQCNIPIDWRAVRFDCDKLVRLYIAEYFFARRYDKDPPKSFSLQEKLAMVENLLEYFKAKHGVPGSDNSFAYTTKLIEELNL